MRLVWASSRYSLSCTKHTVQQFWVAFVLCHNIDIIAININIPLTLDYEINK
jgi:hypothetical protein